MVSTAARGSPGRRCGTGRYGRVRVLRALTPEAAVWDGVRQQDNE